MYMSNYDRPADHRVSAAEGKLRLWRNTSLAVAGRRRDGRARAAHRRLRVRRGPRQRLPPGRAWSGCRPRPAPTPEYLQDFGNTVAPGTTTHHLTLYRAASGALVFRAGTHPVGVGPRRRPRRRRSTAGGPADAAGARSTCSPTWASSRRRSMPAWWPRPSRPTPPRRPRPSPSPAAGAAVANGTTVDRDRHGDRRRRRASPGSRCRPTAVPAWHPRRPGTTSWTYTYVQHGVGSVTDPGPRHRRQRQHRRAAATRGVTVTCPCTRVRRTSVPDDPGGQRRLRASSWALRFTPRRDGFVTGVRFYKGTATPAPTPARSGPAPARCSATVTFTNETATGWQTATLRQPGGGHGRHHLRRVLHARPTATTPRTPAYFATERPRRAAAVALGAAPAASRNGVYRDGRRRSRTRAIGAANYCVDVRLHPSTTPPPTGRSTNRVPLPDATSVRTAARSKATFSRPSPSLAAFSLKDAATRPSPGPTPTTRPPGRRPSRPPRPDARSEVHRDASRSAAPTACRHGCARDVVVHHCPHRPPAGLCPCSVWTDDAVPDTAQRVRHPERRAGHEVHSRRQRRGRRRHASTRVRRTSGPTPARSVDRDGHAARRGDLHRRVEHRLADRHLLHPGLRHRRNDRTSSPTARPSAATP